MEKLFINTDGGSRGNPGHAAIGIVFQDADNQIIYCCKEYIGIGTNNEAEYKAIIKALNILAISKWAKDHQNNGQVICRLDSQLVVEQICGRYKVKKDHIREFLTKIRDLLTQIELEVLFVHIPREENKIADKLVNQALDEYLNNNKVD